MNTDIPKRRGLLSGNTGYALVIALISIPLFIILQVIVKRLEIPEDEAATTGFTVATIGSVFIGRYIGGILSFRMNNYPRKLLIVLSIITLALTFWIFVYTEFPLRDRPAMSVLLFALPLCVVSVIVGLVV